MKAIVIAQSGGPENLCLTEYSKPNPEIGMVLIRVKAFGINRAEVYMRKGEWGVTSDIIGVECVGIVEDDLTGNFQKGAKVAAVCGGMARTINGSYAEYVNVPVSNVISLKTMLRLYYSCAASRPENNRYDPVGGKNIISGEPGCGSGVDRSGRDCPGIARDSSHWGGSCHRTGRQQHSS